MVFVRTIKTVKEVTANRMEEVRKIRGLCENGLIAYGICKYL